jgi:vacuolar-type H+-ATPase subunit E/Vma4
VDRLLALVLEEGRAEARRVEDRATNEARRLVNDAEERVEDVTRAARALGRERGAVADRSYDREAEAEIRTVHDRAFDALADRFLRRLARALEELPATPRYPAALAAWARRAAAAMDRPADVLAAPAQRPAVYDALLAAGARDFRVQADHAVRSGFVVRDLDGRTILDVRPAALLAEHGADLRAWLAARVPPFRPDSPGGSGPAVP